MLAPMRYQVQKKLHVETTLFNCEPDCGDVKTVSYFINLLGISMHVFLRGVGQDREIGAQNFLIF
jgi:hypothetical protein